MRYITAGESHGPQLTAIIEGLPAGMPLSIEDINSELKKRQVGYGRGARMTIESDKIQITSGVRHGKTLGSPVTLVLENKDWKNWASVMGTEPVSEQAQLKRQVTRPRPGHADLVGGMKYGHRDLRNVLERSSARETAMRVAIGAISKKLLTGLGVETLGYVTNIGGIKVPRDETLSLQELSHTINASDLRCASEEVAVTIRQKIDDTKKAGDTLGGTVAVIVEGLPPGLGSYTHWDQKLDGKLAQGIMSINAFKGVEIGDGFTAANHFGSEIMDPIKWDQAQGFSRESNHLGGFEGGMTTGEPLLIQGVMKPIPTLYKPLTSVDIQTKEAYKASVERSDTCAVPAASVIAENVTATILATEILATFTSDNYDRLVTEFQSYRKEITNY